MDDEGLPQDIKLVWCFFVVLRMALILYIVIAICKR